MAHKKNKGRYDYKVEVVDEELEAYKEELTQSEEAMLRALNGSRDKRNTAIYSKDLQESLKVALKAEVITTNGIMVSVADKLAASTVAEAIAKPSTGKMLDIMKMTGEYQEKSDVKISGIEAILKKVEGNSEF